MTFLGDFTPAGNFAEQVDRWVLGRFRDGAFWNEDGTWSFSPYYNYTWIWSSLTFGVTVMLGAFAGKIMKETQCDCVKLEGGKSVCPQIKAITDASIPVMAHLGLTPQSVNAFGGFKVQGKTVEAAQQLIEDAKAVEEAGAFAVVLECVPAKLARKVTEALHIPTIGIGAGEGCDGQILVYADMLSMFSDFSPKFVRSFANVGEIMSQAFKDYDAAVKDSSFPAQEHTFKIDEEVLDKLY